MLPTRPIGSDAAALQLLKPRTSASFADKEAVGLTAAESLLCKGFWQETAKLHAKAVKDGTLHSPGHVQLKTCILNDYNAWVVASALLATVGMAGMLVSIPVVDEEGRSIGILIARHVYLLAMALSTMLAISCLNDHITVGNFYNMVPAPFCIQARTFLYERSAQLKPGWHKMLHTCGLGFGSQVFYQSIASLCLGVICFVYLAYGAQFCIAPALVFIVFYRQVVTYNRICHWDAALLPAFTELICNEAGGIEERL